jgi:uncharacterized protein (DUF2236 family)
MLWVLYGLFESFELAFEIFVRRLTPAEKEAHWQGWRYAGLLFGVQADAMPRHRGELAEYEHEMYATDRTWVTDAARRKALPFVLDGRDVDGEDPDKSTVPWFAKPGFELVKSFTYITLPDRIREGYGLPNPAWREKLLVACGAGSRRLNPHLGPAVTWPEARGRAKGAAWNQVRIKPRSDGTRVILDA